MSLSDRKLRVDKPRLHSRSGEEVAVPVYEAMQRDERLGGRMLGILLSGVSTRGYEGVVSRMADTAGASKSSVSRETIVASRKALGELLERRFEEKDLIVVYVDALRFGEQTVIAAVGVDRAGRKHVLGMLHGATENAAAAQDLLASLAERGLSPEKKRLFIIDGSKALPRRWAAWTSSNGAPGAFVCASTPGNSARAARVSAVRRIAHRRSAAVAAAER